MLVPVEIQASAAYHTEREGCRHVHVSLGPAASCQCHVKESESKAEDEMQEESYPGL